MKRILKHSCLASAVIAAAMSTSTAQASLVIAGDLQTEQGNPSDWDPANSTLIMLPLGGGIYSYTVNNLLNGTLYEFKVLDDLGNPPAGWGDPEVVNVNTMAYGDLDGSAVITVDLNQNNGNGGKVTWVNMDNAPLQVVGDFMNEAGGAGDWNPADPTFAMTPQGGGLYTIALNISTPGSYQFKATDGTGWARQVGTDGLGSNAATFGFSTTMPNEALTLYVDLANQAIGVVPEPTTFALTGLGLAALGVAIRRRS
ncbi:MAG: PEP-CTERM sorting domain-containing protein [Verrucomicrobia bacterium]|jgi:hypothetical protein|nr:PEP-CTERM sorting domain-containing protein [Verrucomicrobiota bacterium]